MKPVAFLVFNRPDCTARSFAAIRAARPQKLFVIADGPRPNRPEDQEKCRRVREIIDQGVDWPCEVFRNYAVENMGSGGRVSSGLTWAFSQSERLIVLEDDVLPDPSFFWLCDELLDLYADDQRVGQISASPFICNEIDRPYSYIFSRYGPCWGWASWARAWKYFSYPIDSWEDIDSSDNFRTFMPIGSERRLKRRLYRSLTRPQRNVWDMQWGFAKMSNSMLSAVPTRNLIQNTGFGPDATHCHDPSLNILKPASLTLPIKHPPRVLSDARFVEAFSLTCCGKPWRRVLAKAMLRFDRILAYDRHKDAT